MLYAYKTLTDEFGHEITFRVGRATNSVSTAKRQLARLNWGEIRDEHNRLFCVKRNSEIRYAVYIPA